MKHISICALLAILAMPAFADDEISSPIIDSVAKDVAEKISAPVEKQDITDAAVADTAPVAETAPEKSKTAFPHGLQIGVGASVTSGLNGFIGYANKDFDSFWAKRFGVRFDFATTSPIKSVLNKGIDAIMDDGIDIGDGLTITDGALDATHYAVMVDFYPFGNTWFLGGWRLSGGYYMGEMNMDANISGSFDGTAELDWEYRGPYVGTGFDFGLFAGFKIYLDAGVVFTNRAAELSLDIPTDNLQQLNGATWESVDIPELDAVIAETLADAQDELNDFKFYPIVKLGFMYRF